MDASPLNALLPLLQKVPAILWTAGLDARFTSLTGAAIRCLGISPADYTGKAIGDLFLSVDHGRLPAEAHRLALSGEPCSFQLAILGHQMEAHIEPLRDSSGSITGVMGVALEGSFRAVAQRALRLSEQSYRLLIEEAPYAICRATVSGQLLQVNRFMMNILGYPPQAETDLLERDLPLIFGSAMDFEDLRDRLIQGSTVQGLETTWLSRDGSPIQVRVGGRAVRDPSGQVLCLDLLAENITERKLLEARLIQAEKMQAVGQLAGGIAHDFNNLLTVISGQIELVLADPIDDPIRARLEDAREASQRAASLTRQLLAFSRGQVLQSKIIDINSLIERLMGMLGRLIRENINLKFVSEAGLGMVRADPSQIEQVLLNLAVNAQDAMPSGGDLTIATAAVEIPSAAAGIDPGRYLLISVSDTGHGMDSGTQARIFEPFFTTKRRGEGTGLGLATVYGIVRQSGGHIQVESQVGRGSTFRIYLPCADGQESARTEPAAQDSPTGHETILLAEDEVWVRKMVAAHLKDLGYQVLLASDGADALELARAHTGPIHLLLSDLIMPRIDGRELARQLRQSNPRLRVIFVSGYAGQTQKELNLPRAAFLSKPFSMQQLARKVREALDKRG